MYSIEDGRVAIKLARYTLIRYFDSSLAKDKPKQPVKFGSKSGVFVTLNQYPSKRLRGCIGYILPVMKLGKAIRENAINAALKDPRFPPLGKDELQNIVIEVSLLTVPEPIEYSKLDDLVEKIEIGRDGLIVEKGFYKGLLLPQVPVEWEWDVETFLDHTCSKAGLPPNTWRNKPLIIKRFTASVFAEETPSGNVKRKDLI